MTSTILPNDRCSVFAATPTDGQIFVDSERVQWVYDAEASRWERFGTVETVPLADAENSGLMSASDKRLLDNIPAVGGGFGLIVDTKHILHSDANPAGVIQGDIKLVSDSLNIQCVDSSLEKITTTTFTNDCRPCETKTETEVDVISQPGLQFELNEKFLKTLLIDLPGPRGSRGLSGPEGFKGAEGPAEGPVGNQGLKGANADHKCELNGIKYEDLSGLTDSAIINMEMADVCEIILTKAKLDVSLDPADKIVATPATRSVTFGSSSTCDLTNMDNWSLTGGVDMQLIRLAKGSQSDEMMFNAMSLSDFVTDVVGHYKEKLVAIDEKWGKELKEFTESVDDKARGIISSLANDVSMCEFNLPATEYCITLEECGSSNGTTTTTTSTTTTSTTTTTTSTTTTSPTPVAAARANTIHDTIKISGNKFSSVNVGMREWEIKS